MPHFIAIVHKDPNSAWGVSFPDLPGCFSAADQESDLLPNAMEALELFSEDAGELPRPSSIEALRAKPEVAEDLAAGAFLLSVPLLHNAAKTTRVNITLDKGLLEAIDEEAARRKMTRSGLLAQAAAKEIAG
jgi:predicted RNase H-like HicB family nuclease